MKKWFCLFILISVNAIAAKNWALQGAIPKARAQVLQIDDITESDWDGFLKYIQPFFASTLGKDEDGYTAWLVAEFDKWKSNTMIHEDEEAFADEDTRREFDPSVHSRGTMSSPPRSVGRGSMASGSTLSTRVFGPMGHGIARTEACMAEIRTLRQALDLTTPQAREGLRDRLEASADSVQPTLVELFNSATLRASYIKVLLDSATHRGEVLAAINAPANGAFRTALIQSLLADPTTRKQIVDALHAGHQGEMIAKLHGNADSRGAVINHLSTNHSGDMVAKVVESHRADVITALIPAHIGEIITALVPAHMANFTALLGTNEGFRTAMLNGLLGDAHRNQVINALIPAHLDAVLAIHRDTILERLGMGNLDGRIANLRDDATNRGDIAQAFVAHDAFRNALIGRMEAGRYAINATRMLWHDVDGDDAHGAFWGLIAANTPNIIVTKAAFDHLTQKARDGYQALGHGLVTNPRGKFRAEFARGNRVGKDGTHLGSTEAT